MIIRKFAKNLQFVLAKEIGQIGKEKGEDYDWCY